MIHYTGALEKRAHTAISYSRIFVITGAFYNIFELKKFARDNLTSFHFKSCFELDFNSMT